MLKIGEQYRSTMIVKEVDTAISHGSGGLEVFATPAMIALMESAAYLLLKQEPHLLDSVGVKIDANHTRACLVGTEVYAIAQVTNIEEKKISFTITAYDNLGEIGKSEHIRYIINPDKFMSKLRG